MPCDVAACAACASGVPGFSQKKAQPAGDCGEQDEREGPWRWSCECLLGALSAKNFADQVNGRNRATSRLEDRSSAFFLVARISASM